MPVTWPYDSGATRLPPGGIYCDGTLNRVPVTVAECVAVGAFDAEQVDLRREHDARRKVPLDSDGRHESRPIQSRITVRVGYVGVGLHLALGDRRLTDHLDRPRRERRLVVAEVGAGACQRNGAVDGKDLVGDVAGDLRRDSALHPHSEDRAVAINDGDDGVVHIGGRGSALEKRT